MAVKRWMLVGLLAAVFFAIVARADDDEDEEAGSPTPMPEGGLANNDAEDGIDAEDAANDIADAAEDDDASAGQFGVRAWHYFPKYADLKVPAGERVEILVPVSSALQNPTYEIMMVTGHISLLDHSRFIQNFSAQLYQRTVEAGETATVKYSVTPDALLDPMEYAFVVAVYVRNIDDNTTFAVAAVNGTMFVQDPLGVDFKGYFSIIVFFGSIGGGIYYYAITRKPARAASRRKEAVETGTKDTAYDPEFVDKSHIAYATQPRTSSPPKRNRSASK